MSTVLIITAQMKPGGGMDGGQFDAYGQMNVQQDMQQDGNNMPMSMQMQLQQQQQQQQRVAGMNNPNQQQQQVNQQQQQQQLLNAQRMMRPVMPNTNPGLRLLLQQQVDQYRSNVNEYFNRFYCIPILAATNTERPVPARWNGRRRHARQSGQHWQSAYGWWRATAQSERTV